MGGREELSRKVALFTAGVVKSLRRFLKIVARVCSRCQVDCSDPSPKHVTTRLILEKVHIPSNVRFDRKDCQRFWSAKFGFSNGVWNVVLLIILSKRRSARAVICYIICFMYTVQIVRYLLLYLLLSKNVSKSSPVYVFTCVLGLRYFSTRAVLRKMFRGWCKVISTDCERACTDHTPSVELACQISDGGQSNDAHFCYAG